MIIRSLRSQIRICLILALGFCLTDAFAQGTVKGTVTSKTDGMPLPGVNVFIKGKSRGAYSDAEGRYTVQVNPGETLTFSYLGFMVQEVPVSTQTVLDISLEEDVTNVREVVVTALGISKENRKLGYAVSTVNGEQLNKAREANFALSLQGTVPGLNVKGNSGGPGGTAQILLRGMPSMNSGGSPLFVINGIPMDNTQRGSAGEWGGADNGDGIGNLNPDDIETMTVLKGQSASALYGARASNGVILITTKKGKKNEFSVEYNTNLMTDHVMDLTDFQYEYGQGINGAKPTTVALALQTGRQSWGARLDGSPVIQWDGNQYPYSAQRDNLENFYRAGSSFTNTVAVSKGGENGSVRLSASNLDNKSIVPNSGLVRRTFNLSVDQRIAKKLSVSAMANFVNEESDNRAMLSDTPLNPNNGILLATNVNQEILAPGTDPTGRELLWNSNIFVTNPYFVTNEFENDLSRKRLISSLMARYEIASWIYAQGRIGYDFISDESFRVTPTGTAYSFDNLGRSGSINDLSQLRRTELNMEGIIGFNRKITADLAFDGLVGGNIRKNESSNVSVNGGPFNAPNVYSMSNVANRNAGYGYAEQAVYSGFYSLDLDYKNFLTLNTTGRYDDYSTLYSLINPTKQTGIFTPSVSTSFVFTELADLGKLSFGKIRASLAQTSGELANPYETALYYSTGNSFNGRPVGLLPSTFPNSTLNPFTLTEFELGTELRFFRNRLGVDLAWYNRTTKNEIMNSNFSPTAGFTSGFVGTGSTRNTGYELQLRGTPVRLASGFEWNVTFNFTYNQNEIVATDPTNSNINLGSNRATLGNAVTAFVPGFAGPQILAFDYKRNASGQIVVNSTGLPVRGDLIKMGSVLPTHFGGLLNNLSYKGFNFSSLIDYNFGNKVVSATEHWAMVFGLHKNTLVGREGITTGVTEAGADNRVQASAQDYYTAVARNITASNVVSGDFIKLRQVTLGYQIPGSRMGRLPFQSIQISLVGRNLAILMRDAKNIDPEASFSSNIRYAGMEGMGLPAVRSFGFNLNFKFK